MEYLVNDEAPKYWYIRKNEWAVVKTVEVEKDFLKKLGDFITENGHVNLTAKLENCTKDIRSRRLKIKQTKIH